MTPRAYLHLTCLAVLLAWGGLGALMASPAGAQESTVLRQGDPAPQDGVFLPLPALQRLIEALRDAETREQQQAVLLAQIAELEAAVAASGQEKQALLQALEAMKLAVAKAEWIDTNFERIVQRYEVYSEKLEKRIDNLERQRNMALIGGPAAGLLILLLFLF